MLYSRYDQYWYRYHVCSNNVRAIFLALISVGRALNIRAHREIPPPPPPAPLGPGTSVRNTLFVEVGEEPLLLGITRVAGQQPQLQG